MAALPITLFITPKLFVSSMFLPRRISGLALAALVAYATTAVASEGGVPPSAEVLIPLGQNAAGHAWGITNSMVTGWVISAFAAALVLWLVGKPSILPSRGQAVVEALIESLRGLFEPIVGKKAFPASFPLLVTLFIFILVHNWMGLIPGVGTIGWGHDLDGHFIITRPLIRPHNSDFNGTIALALISFGAWAIIILKYAGPKFIYWDLFGNKADKKETPGWLYPILSLIFFIVGFVEVFSICIRPFTLSVRLFGNIFGGENLLHGTHFFFIFYFMELLVGLIQTIVFTLLSSVYIGLICNHGDDHEPESGHAAATHH
ncbi:MAG: F0F1 ATP synthase subunit A [Opitutaceae bacterium]|nr:F0F1 ATP synthase subunit A [Opitutaceae bacterium]